MCKEQYDLTYDDLNPTFLYHCRDKRIISETNYHCHDFIELLIILKGEGDLLANGVLHHVSEGDLIILNPGDYHQSIVTNQENTLLECYIGFSNIHLRGMDKDRFYLHNNQYLHHMEADLKQGVFRICNAIEQEFCTRKPGRYFMLKSYLVQLLLLLIRTGEEPDEGQDGFIFESVQKKYVVQQIINYFDQHYQEKISLDQIAQNMYLSTFYVSRIFKNEIGDTPINYLINIRLEKAKELLKAEPELPISDVAAAVGYDDVFHFSKLFKKHYGVSPSQYRSGNIQV